MIITPLMNFREQFKDMLRSEAHLLKQSSDISRHTTSICGFILMFSDLKIQVSHYIRLTLRLIKMMLSNSIELMWGYQKERGEYA
jgi:hypothetical protein